MDLVFVELDSPNVEPGTDDLWVRTDLIGALEATDGGCRVLVDGWFIDVQQTVPEVLGRARAALELAGG